MPSERFGILVLCTGNSARSQIAEALLATRGVGRVRVDSAGSRPAAQVNPGAIAVLRAHDVHWQPHAPRGIDALQGRGFDLVITVCDDARDACPIFPNARAQVHWGMRDPAAVEDAAARHRSFENTFEVLERRVRALLALPLETMTDAELRASAAVIPERVSS